jgi:heme exporter protein C
MKKNWWKIVSIILLYYTIFQGFLGEIPVQPILNETARNLYFHVTMWFAMIILLVISLVYSINYLKNGLIYNDTKAAEFTNTAILFGIFGCITGSIWGNFTWGDPWPNDPKLNSAAIGMLIYFAYLVLRSSFDDEQKRARISAIYNIFAFAVFIPLIFILPRMTDSLHPGSGGNPGLKPADTNNAMRIVFYPAIIGWALLGLWITTLRLRLKVISTTINDI